MFFPVEVAHIVNIFFACLKANVFVNPICSVNFEPLWSLLFQFVLLLRLRMMQLNVVVKFFVVVTALIIIVAVGVFVID